MRLDFQEASNRLALMRAMALSVGEALIRGSQGICLLFFGSSSVIIACENSQFFKIIFSIPNIRGFMTALIFTLQAIALALVMRQNEGWAKALFWLSFSLTVAWTMFHATDSLQIAL